MKLIIGKDYKGVFGTRKAVYEGEDNWYYEQTQSTEEHAKKTVENFWNTGIFALYAKCENGFYVSFGCKKPEATKAVLKS